MGIDNDKPTYLFNQSSDAWFIYMKEYKRFIQLYEIPTLTQNFAGIGTRNLKLNGQHAIREIYKHTFNNG